MSPSVLYTILTSWIRCLLKLSRSRSMKVPRMSFPYFLTQSTIRVVSIQPFSCTSICILWKFDFFRDCFCLKITYGRSFISSAITASMAVQHCFSVPAIWIITLQDPNVSHCYQCMMICKSFLLHFNDVTLKQNQFVS